MSPFRLQNILAPLAFRGRLVFVYRELDLLFDWIDAIHQHAYLLAQTVDLAVALADDFASVFVVVIAVVG